jgi:Na+-translocating ferredoxin:NAD+ oxidoreductase RnfG subunit
MTQNEYMTISTIGVFLCGVIGWFIKSAINKIDLKADKAALEKVVETLRQEQKDGEERYRREADKMERQYDIKFAGVVSTFQDKMNAMEMNLSTQIAMVVKLLTPNKN